MGESHKTCVTLTLDPNVSHCDMHATFEIKYTRSLFESKQLDANLQNRKCASLKPTPLEKKGRSALYEVLGRCHTRRITLRHATSNSSKHLCVSDHN